MTTTDDEEIPEKIYPEYLPIREYTFRGSDEGDGSNLCKIVGYVIHQCEHCIIVALALTHIEDGEYAVADMMVVNLEDIQETKVLREPLGIVGNA